VKAGNQGNHKGCPYGCRLGLPRVGAPLVGALWPCAIVLVTILLLTACAAPPDVPTYRVERRAFEHQVSAEGLLQAARSTPITVPTEVEGRVRVAWLAPDGARVEEGEVVALLDGGELRENLEKGQADLLGVRLDAEKSEIESTVRQADLEKDLRIAELELGVAETFQKKDGEVFSRHDIIESEIDAELAGERREFAEGAQATETGLESNRRQLLEIRRRQAELQIARAERGLESLEIRAPHAGILQVRSNWRGQAVRVGTELWRGQPLGELPDLDRLEAEVYVLEADAGGLEQGRGASVVVEAHPGVEYRATIASVDKVARPRVPGLPLRYFAVTLDFEGEGPETAKPGQRVRATLELENLDDVLVVPRQAIYQREGESWVRVQSGRDFEPRRVEVGAASLGLVVVEKGLDEGEVVVLEPAPVGEVSGG